MMESLLDRLLTDAGVRADRGESREAHALLAWAATIAPRGMMPRVLLAFHRVRAASPPGAGERVPVPVPPVESDRLGFPVPRFASRPPELDRKAFVPAPRFQPDRLATDRSGREDRSRESGRRARGVLITVVLGAAVAGTLLMQLQPGVAPEPQALIVRGRAHLAVGDTPAAVVSFQRSMAHPAASADDVLASARELAQLRCCAAAAADAYILAMERGVTSDRYPEIAQELERLGRADQAGRVRELGRDD
jgi:hypothetical protein